MKIVNYEIKLKNKSFGNYQTRNEIIDRLQEIKNSNHEKGIYKVYSTKENGQREVFDTFTL